MRVGSSDELYQTPQTPQTNPARVPRAGLALVLWILLAVTLLLGVGLGSSAIPLETIFSALHKGIFKGILGQSLTPLESIVWEMRLPRAILGLLVGSSLGIAGASYQGLFRNPLADPYLMGVASGGVLGVTVAFVLHAAFTWIPAFAFVFAFGSVLLTLLLAQQRGQISTLRLILAGVVVGSVVLALSSYLSLIRADLVREVTAWTLGSLTFGSWTKIGSILPYWAIGTALLWSLARPLNTLQLGEATAYSLGVPVARLRWTVILASTLLTAAAVSYAGIIGFVGLMTPHILRRLIGANLSRLLPLSALAGGVFLVLADILARVIARPTELPVGLLTTLLGGPFFLYLLRKQS